MKKQYVILIIILTFVANIYNTFAQINPEWADTNYTSIYPINTVQFDMKTDFNGNVYTTGYTLDTANFPATKIIKYNSSGIIQWEDIMDSTHYNTRIAVDTSGNVYVSGTSYSGPNGLHLLKYDSSGTLLWDKIFTQGAWIHDIVVDDSSYVIIASQINPYFVTLKIDWNGDIVWVRQDSIVNGLGNSYLSTDNLCNIYLAARTWYTNIQHADIFKYNSDGNKQWQTTYSGNFPSGGAAPAGLVYKDGFVYLLSGTVTYTPTSIFDMSVVKYDTSGSFVWEGVYNGPPNNPTAVDLDVDDWGNVYISGQIYSGSGPNDAIETIRFDSTGSLKWTRTYSLGQGGLDKPSDIMVDQMGFIYVTGQSGSPTLYQSFVTIKYDSSGSELWVARYNNAIGSSDRANSIGMDAFGNIYISGTSYDNFGSCILTLKYAFYTSLEESIISSSDINVYPNPFIDQIQINSPLMLINATFILYDLTGRRILELPCTNKTKMSISRNFLHSGLYLYQIKQDNLVLNRGKIVAN